jgi:hypothetical protein
VRSKIAPHLLINILLPDNAEFLLQHYPAFFLKGNYVEPSGVAIERQLPASATIRRCIAAYQPARHVIHIQRGACRTGRIVYPNGVLRRVGHQVQTIYTRLRFHDARPLVPTRIFIARAYKYTVQAGVGHASFIGVVNGKIYPATFKTAHRDELEGIYVHAGVKYHAAGRNSPAGNGNTGKQRIAVHIGKLEHNIYIAATVYWYLRRAWRAVSRELVLRHITSLAWDKGNRHIAAGIAAKRVIEHHIILA